MNYNEIEKNRKKISNLGKASGIIKDMVEQFGHKVPDKKNTYNDGGLDCIKDALDFLVIMGIAYSEDGVEYKIFKGN